MVVQLLKVLDYSKLPPSDLLMQDVKSEALMIS